MNKLKKFYHDYVRFEYCSHPASRIYSGIFIFSLGMGAVLSSFGYSTLAMLSYVCSTFGLFSAVGTEVSKILDERREHKVKEAYFQSLYEAEDLITIIEDIDEEYERLEGKV